MTKKKDRKSERRAIEVWSSSQRRQAVKKILEQNPTHRKAPSDLERKIYKAMLVLHLRTQPGKKISVPRREATLIVRDLIEGGGGILKLDNTETEWVLELLELEEPRH